MAQDRKMLPIGIEFFDELRKKDFYYVDKTGLIRELLTNHTKVTLFTRPRRFGKTLNMSMLANFFSLDGDKHLFAGLKIAKEKALCARYQGKFPVIFLSLKDIDALNYGTAYQRAAQLIMEAAERYYFLLDSARLNEQDKTKYRKLLADYMNEGTLGSSLKLLSALLEKHYGTKVVLLIDEYDVPLARAHLNGYYEPMASLLRSLLGSALKSNTSLELAVLTGCLRVSKESIFTGLNNLQVFSIADECCADYFGFTDSEVHDLLAYYGVEDSYGAVKEWYNGYQFGNAEVYCPWDVLNHCFLLRKNAKAKPKNYWINTSGNDVIKQFIGMADSTTRQEIETLVAGGCIEKNIREELTYQDMYASIDNLWSLLFATGYLTQRGETEEGLLKLSIPNLEVRDVFVKQIREFFKESVRKDTTTLGRFCTALLQGEAETVEELFSQYLERTISIRDAAAPEGWKESFYHGNLLGILAAEGEWTVQSNREGGTGYPDILARSPDGKTGVVIELKYAADGDLAAACRAALGQIEARQYRDAFKYTRVKAILKYGIGCYRKSCQVVLER